MALLGTLAIVFAGLSRVAFLEYGEDGSSMFMAILFGVAVMCYVTLLYLLPNQSVGTLHNS